jgi:hypothetical protein
VTQVDAQAMGGIGSEVESIVSEMEALRQAVEETDGPDLSGASMPDTNAPTTGPPDANPSSASTPDDGTGPGTQTGTGSAT